MCSESLVTILSNTMVGDSKNKGLPIWVWFSTLDTEADKNYELGSSSEIRHLFWSKYELKKNWMHNTVEEPASDCLWGKATFVTNRCQQWYTTALQAARVPMFPYILSTYPDWSLKNEYLMETIVATSIIFYTHPTQIMSPKVWHSQMAAWIFLTCTCTSSNMLCSKCAYALHMSQAFNLPKYCFTIMFKLFHAHLHS